MSGIRLALVLGVLCLLAASGAVVGYLVWLFWPE